MIKSFKSEDVESVGYRMIEDHSFQRRWKGWRSNINKVGKLANFKTIILDFSIKNDFFTAKPIIYFTFF